MTIEADARAENGQAKVAVIGSGISGLSAAWLLSRSMDVTIFEAEGRAGGHAHTVDVDGPGGAIAVDTGFIVFNERNYPNLVALFQHLDVPTQVSDMSFAASIDGGRLEYSGSGLSGLFGQKSNAISPRFWSMVADILRFYREAPQALEKPDVAGITLGAFLEAGKYRSAFIEDHILPMGAAIWSTSADDIRGYPLEAFLRFFVNHGLLLLKDRPRWRTVSGGSRAYVTRLLDSFRGTLHVGAPVTAVHRDDGGATVTCRDGTSERFDHVVIATHADEALSLLADADGLERKLLGAFSYTPNEAVLHCDQRLMPKRRQVWASWNYIGGASADGTAPLCVTYWMNRLQDIDMATPLFVTLNPGAAIDPAKIHRSVHYRHPLFNAAAIAAQKDLWQLQGRSRSWFCGAYFGSGFHEDGLQAGLAVAEELAGVKRPWQVEDESGRIFLGSTRVGA